ncbi:hypothetical protein DsansV1_C01g0005641 [Dioscorea sansibarensis]
MHCYSLISSSLYSKHLRTCHTSTTCGFQGRKPEECRLWLIDDGIENSMFSLW